MYITIETHFSQNLFIFFSSFVWCSTVHWTLILNASFSSVQLLSHLQFFVTPWIVAHQASLSITNSRSRPKPMSIESVMPSNLCCPLLLLPLISQHQVLFQWVSSSYQMAKVLAFYLQHLVFQWIFRTDFLRTGWISLQFKGLSRVFSNTIQKNPTECCKQCIWNSHLR